MPWASPQVTQQRAHPTQGSSLSLKGKSPNLFCYSTFLVASGWSTLAPATLEMPVIPCGWWLPYWTART